MYANVERFYHFLPPYRLCIVPATKKPYIFGVEGLNLDSRHTIVLLYHDVILVFR